MKVQSEFDNITIIEEFEFCDGVYGLNFNGNYLVEIDNDCKLTGNAINGYGQPINPFNYSFSIEILEC